MHWYVWSIMSVFLSIHPLLQPPCRLQLGALHHLRVQSAGLEQLRPRPQRRCDGHHRRGQAVGGGATSLAQVKWQRRHHPAALAATCQTQRCASSLLFWRRTRRSAQSKKKNTLSLSFWPGDIVHYVVLRDGQERYRGDEFTFTDVGGISPYQGYRYQLRACSRAGCTDSTQVSPHDTPATTLQRL